LSRGKLTVVHPAGPVPQEHAPSPAEPRDPDFRALVLGLLEAQLRAADRILAQTRDPAWLGRQSAAELALLYGVLFEKSARILGALPTGDDPPTPSEASP
jgi:hypothetical protein